MLNVPTEGILMLSLHVNPSGNEKGLLMVYNPLNQQVRKKLRVNVYYTGLSKKVTLTDSKGKSERFEIDRDYNILVPVNIEPNSEEWYIMK